MIDDAISVSDCGRDTVTVNAIIQSKVELKNLRLGHSKCFKMHVGKKQQLCRDLFVDNWELQKVDIESSWNLKT